MTGKPTYEELDQRVKEPGKICRENTNASAREHITERKRAEEDRRKSERRYRHLLEGLPDIVWSFSDKRGILFASGRVEKIIGYSPEYLYKNPWLWNQSIHPDDKNDVDKAIACFAAGKDLDVEYRIKDASGNWRWFHDRSIDRRMEDDEVIIEGISTDITARKRTEELLRESDEQYRTIGETVPYGVWLTDATGYCTYVSKSFLELVDRTMEQVQEVGWLHLLPPEDVEPTKEHWLHCVETGEHFEREHRFRAKDGNYRNVLAIGRPIKDATGKIIKWVGLNLDITEHKRAEEALEISVQLLRDTGEMAKVGGWELDLSTKEILFTEELYRIHGLDPGYNLKLEEALDFYAPESRPDVEAVVKKAAETGETYDLESLFIPRGSKDKIWVRSLGRAVYSGGKIVKLTGTFQNIDKYKRTEEALRQAESNFRHSLDDSPLGVRIVTMEGETIYANRAILDIYGFDSIEELKTTTVEKRYTPESYAEFQIRKKKRQRGGYGPPEYEISIVKKNGEVRHLQVFRKEIFWNGERRFQVIYRDISERKRAEEALIKEKETARKYLDIAGVIIVAINRVGEVILINKKGCEVLGYDEKYILGKNWFDHFIPAWLKEELVPVSKKLFDGDMQSVEYHENPILTKNGKERMVAWHNTVLRDDEGNIIEHLSSGEDISERKHAEDALRESEARFSTIFHSSPVSISLVRMKDNQLIDINDAWQKMTGFSREEAIGRTAIKLNLYVNPGDRDQLISRLSGEGMVKNFEFKALHKSGSLIDVLMSARFIDIAGEQHMLTLTQDITEQKRLEFLVQQRQKMETLGTLVAGVAHEINNPINTIMNNAPLLRSVWKDLLPLVEERAEKQPGRRYGGLTGGFLKENLDQLISDIDMAANRVASIVKGLKDFSRKTSPLEKQQVDINIAVENAIRLAGSTIRKSGITLALDLAPNLPSINANLQNLEQIILNLAINAVQAIDHDHGEIKIATTHNKNQGTIVLSVQDNGKGISPAISDKIFDPFFTEWQSIGGTGLGLPITQNLVKANDGEITFKSRVGKGAAFLVAFTVERKKKPFKILLVDDNEAVLEAIKQALTIERHYMVEQASDGNEALIKIGIYHPDLLILDIFMPQMDGVEVCRAIQKHPELHDLKVIIFTGYPEHEKVKEVAEMGFTKVVDKLLFDLQELMKEVDGMLRI